MKRISSRSTLFYKRCFPLLWFGFLAVFVIADLWASRRTHVAVIPFLIMPVVMAVFGYAIFRRLIFDLVDEVWDDGDALIVRNAGTEERVALKNIINVGFSTMTNPERVTSALRERSHFGKEITFSPPRRFLAFFSRSPIINELLERVDQARRERF
jgi:hypothetical protein